MNKESLLRQSIASHAARLLLRGEVATLHQARRKAARKVGIKKLTAQQRPLREEIQQQLSLFLHGTHHHEQRNIEKSHVVETLGNLQKLIAPVACSPSTDLVDVLKTGHGLTKGFRVRVLVDCSREELEDCLCDAELSNAELSNAELNDGKANRTEGILIHFQGIDFALFLRQENENLESTVDSLLSEFLSLEQFQEQLFASGPLSDFNAQQTETSHQLPWLLLEKLESIRISPVSHPEGDLLYHALQVFELGMETHSLDAEFLEACLFHDVGFITDRRHPREASAEAVAGCVSARTQELIRRLDEGHEYLKTGYAPKALRKSNLYDDLIDLARYDRDGRMQGMPVRSLEEVKEHLENIFEEWNE